jgi:hypothetical protein
MREEEKRKRGANSMKKKSIFGFFLSPPFDPPSL